MEKKNMYGGCPAKLIAHDTYRILDKEKEIDKIVKGKEFVLWEEVKDIIMYSTFSSDGKSVDTKHGNGFS